MDLSINYLGLRLSHPLMPGASPLVDDLDKVRAVEDAGASAIVMRSLFEEQIVGEQMAVHRRLQEVSESFAEALSYFPTDSVFHLGPESYLERLRRIREMVSVPVIGSLNGTTVGGWLEYAKLMEQAGAHALELNLYNMPTDPLVDAARVEAQSIEVVKAVTAAVAIPVAVKLSPFYSSLPAFARQVEAAGAKGVVLFNRFYQADIDVENLELARSLHLSDSSELLLRLRWLAILSGRTGMSLAASGGVHSATDAVKALMAGAHAVQVVSALLHHGPGHLRQILGALKEWLEAHEYESMDQLVGSMNLSRSPDPAAYERANYIHVLQRGLGR